MGLPATIQHDGALSVATAPGGPASSLQDILRTTFSATYSMSKGARPGIVGATDGSPYQIPFETITKCRLFALRTRNGSIKVRLTSAVGTLQQFNVSDILLIHSPNAGDEFTAIALVGTGDIEYLIAGDTN